MKLKDLFHLSEWFVFSLQFVTDSKETEVQFLRCRKCGYETPTEPLDSVPKYCPHCHRYMKNEKKLNKYFW